jgi:hypothetical protein
VEKIISKNTLLLGGKISYTYISLIMVEFSGSKGTA